MNDAGWVVNTPEPRFEINKVDSNWYTYLIRAQGVVTMGHGSKSVVFRAVSDALASHGGKSL